MKVLPRLLGSVVFELVSVEFVLVVVGFAANFCLFETLAESKLVSVSVETVVEMVVVGTVANEVSL